MTSSILLSPNNFILFKHHKLVLSSSNSNNFLSHHQHQLSFQNQRFTTFISKAKNHKNKKDSSTWWQKFFQQDDGNWLGLREDDMVEEDVEFEVEEEEQELSEDEKFEAWKQRAEAIIDIREAQEDRKNQDHRKWEDWLLEDEDVSSSSSSSSSWESGMKDYREELRGDDDVFNENNGVVQSVKYLIFGRKEDGDNDDDMLYEDRVFNYASSNSVCALCARACLIHSLILGLVWIDLFLSLWK